LIAIRQVDFLLRNSKLPLSNIKFCAKTHTELNNSKWGGLYLIVCYFDFAKKAGINQQNNNKSGEQHEKLN
jgi:hypothetical protein